jgi:hypothetical protein
VKREDNGSCQVLLGGAYILAGFCGLNPYMLGG